MKILLIEDDLELAESLAAYLQGQQIEARLAYHPDAAIEQLETEGFDAVLLDVMLPVVSGFELLPRVRSLTDAPILMLTALSDEESRVTGLNLGADDYICKPFSAKELVARLRAFNRRYTPRTTADVRMSYANLTLNPETQTAIVADTQVMLTAAESRLLAALIKARGKPVARESLYRSVLGRTALPTDRSLDTHISNLRRKLAASAEHPPTIRAHRGIGYGLSHTCTA
ncbi:MAG: response regulator transcription factor [Pseudomonadota bacterium]